MNVFHTTTMENNNFLQRAWKGELAENQISANQVFINENDGANEKYVQKIWSKGPLKISVKEFSFNIDANNKANSTGTFQGFC